MRKYLKSLMVAVTGIALIGSAAYAFEGLSIKSENTFTFYENEFDYMLMPAKLAGQDSTLAEGHKLVEGFTGYRLFTNLTNQAGQDAYQIGGIIPIPNGLGNVGVLFDYRKSEGNGVALDCVNCGKAYLNPLSVDNRYNRDWESADGFNEGNLEGDEYSSTQYTDLDPYNGSLDAMDLSSGGNFDTNKDEAWNLYLGYGLPIANTPISVGVSYTYGSIEGDADRSAPALELADTTAETTPGNSYSEFDNYNENSDWEYESHKFAVEARYNASPLDSLLGVSWKISDGNNGFWDRETNDNGAANTTVGNAGPFRRIIGGGALPNNQLYSTYSGTDIETTSGDAFFPFCGWGNREGDKYSVYTENIFELNPTIAFGLDVAYRIGSYDDKLEGSTVRNVDESGRVAGDGVTQTASLDSVDNWDLDGDINNDEFNVRGEMRLTFPKVQFGLGVVYNNFGEDGDYKGNYTFNETVVYDDNTLTTSDSFTKVSSASGTRETDYEIDQETWRFPVSTEFNITERLVGRLGAEYVYGDWDMDVRSSVRDLANESIVKTYENGDQVFTPIDKDGAAYDNDTNIDAFKLSDNDTYSYVIYNVGLGYQVTENLNVDAMWRRTDSDAHDTITPTLREGVSTDILFVGATLAF